MVSILQTNIVLMYEYSFNSCFEELYMSDFQLIFASTLFKLHTVHILFCVVDYSSSCTVDFKIRCAILTIPPCEAWYSAIPSRASTPSCVFNQKELPEPTDEPTADRANNRRNRSKDCSSETEPCMPDTRQERG